MSDLSIRNLFISLSQPRNTTFGGSFGGKEETLINMRYVKTITPTHIIVVNTENRIAQDFSSGFDNRNTDLKFSITPEQYKMLTEKMHMYMSVLRL